MTVDNGQGRFAPEPGKFNAGKIAFGAVTVTGACSVGIRKPCPAAERIVSKTYLSGPRGGYAPQAGALVILIGDNPAIRRGHPCAFARGVVFIGEAAAVGIAHRNQAAERVVMHLVGDVEVCGPHQHAPGIIAEGRACPIGKHLAGETAGCVVLIKNRVAACVGAACQPAGRIVTVNRLAGGGRRLHNQTAKAVVLKTGDIAVCVRHRNRTV